jgi:hypothetical protein
MHRRAASLVCLTTSTHPRCPPHRHPPPRVPASVPPHRQAPVAAVAIRNHQLIDFALTRWSTASRCAPLRDGGCERWIGGQGREIGGRSRRPRCARGRRHNHAIEHTFDALMVTQRSTRRHGWRRCKRALTQRTPRLAPSARLTDNTPPPRPPTHGDAASTHAPPAMAMGVECGAGGKGHHTGEGAWVGGGRRNVAGRGGDRRGAADRFWRGSQRVVARLHAVHSDCIARARFRHCSAAGGRCTHGQHLARRC